MSEHERLLAGAAVGADGVEMSTMVMPACASATKTSDPAIATRDARPGVSKVAALTGTAGFEAS